jgi:DNA repair exonuclease SbcCD ATPase subunit
MKYLRFLTLFIVMVTVFAGCNGSEEKPVNKEADSLKNVANKLSGSLNEKEAVIQEFIESFNEIQENLNAIKEKEKIVSNVSSKGDVKHKNNQIKEDIQAIYDLMSKNKTRISALSQKLKESHLKMSGLEKMIENLQTSLNLKDEEIAELRTKMEGLNIELTNLNTNYKAVEAESAQKTDALNTAYYAIGTKKELIEKKVIAKEGGFIGLGKTTKLSEDFNKEYFTKINIEQTTSINLGVKKVKVVSNHPHASYRLVGEKPVEKLEITNAKEFWSSSKYLVIIID